MTRIIPAVKLDKLLDGHIAVELEARVSAKSRFGDECWDFTDERKIRLSSVPDGRLRIDWAKYYLDSQEGTFDDHRGAILTREMVEELKIFSYLYFTAPTAFGHRGVQSVKPQTLVVTLRALILLFSDVLQRHQLIGLTKRRNEGGIRSIFEITLRDIRDALVDSTRVDGAALRKGLKLLASPLMARVFAPKKLHWNAQDVRGLEFKFPGVRVDYRRVMPLELFRLLSNTACSDVLCFLNFIGEEMHDISMTPNPPPIAFTTSAGAQMFADYVTIRSADREHWSSVGKKQPASGPLRRKFRRAYGVNPNDFFQWLYRVQRAAFTVIGQYTGARYSDLTTFTNDCVRTLGGVHVLVGTHTKHENLDAEEGADLWPATPIMRDALTCLRHLSRVTFNPYLLSTSATVPVDGTPEPYSLTGFTSAINSYLHEIDTKSSWEDWHINSHQLRHTLAHQLARADVGLVFISHQMKHLHTALTALPADSTMMYGNVGELALQRAVHSESAHLEAARNLYHPDSPVAGGGAEDFLKRRKSYFEGMAAQGWTVDDVIVNLAKQGMPFASVGPGYCGGKREVLQKDGTRVLPPCLGSLQCNPVDCKQALITKTHERTWRKIQEQNNSMASDPRMSHAKETFLNAAAVADRVVADLNTNQ